MAEQNARDKLLDGVVGNAVREKTRCFREHHREPESFAISPLALEAVKDYLDEHPDLLAARFIDPSAPALAERPITLYGIALIEDESLVADAVRAV